MSERPLWRLVAGCKTGPYEPAKLRPLVKDGRISSLDRFSYDGMSWHSADEFSELLKEPVPVAAKPVERHVAPAAPPRADSCIPPIRPVAVEPDVDTAKLLKAIYWLCSICVGAVVLLMLVMFVTALSGVRKAEPVSPAVVPAVMPAVATPQPPEGNAEQPEPEPEPSKTPSSDLDPANGESPAAPADVPQATSLGEE